MTATIERLPWEIIDIVLNHVVRLNTEDQASFSYGLTGTARPIEKTRLARYLRGHVPPDVQKWNAAAAVRQVNPRWHTWAMAFSLRDLYVRRWRGSERWLEARYLSELEKSPSGIAVYRDSFCSLRKTIELFSDYPSLAASVHRVWFNGFYVAETTQYIFRILAHCVNLQAVTLPWIALRHGNGGQWSRLLANGTREASLSSLELLAVDLKESQIANVANHIDQRPLNHPSLDFGNLTKLKIFGNTNFAPITNDDLRLMARSATQLQELHVTSNSSITIEGVMDLVNGSSETLRILQFSPLSKDGFDHPGPPTIQSHRHFCESLPACPQLSDLSISLPSLCPTLFSRPEVQWAGELQIRFADVCGEAQTSYGRLRDVLASARSLMNTRNQGTPLSIELFTSQWIYEIGPGRIHGNFDMARVLSGGLWPAAEHASRKGPYGQTGLYGKDIGPYSWITEESFVDGLERGYVSCL